MTLSLIVDIADPMWTSTLPGLEELADIAVQHAIVHAAPAYIGIPGTVEIGVTFADDDRMRQLNGQYRGKDKPTNVLSFPLLHADAPPPMGTTILLGDVVLGLQTILREAAETGKSVAAHTQHLIVHGVLHLLGHDHEADRDAELMEAMEIKILDEIGVANPYMITTDAD